MDLAHAAGRRASEIELAWQQYEAEHRTRRGFIPRSLFLRLAGEQNWRCCYCGCAMDADGKRPTRATFEHVVPRSCGGTNSEGNLVIACSGCNTERASVFRDEHYQALAVMGGVS